MVSIPRFHKEEVIKKEQEQSASAPFEAGDLIVSYLEQIGVEYVFGIPGGPIEPLYNALARSARRGGPRPIVARHESGAAFMADGYARETGKLGVCCATTGPGATNMLTGIASAYQDNTPMLVITAQTLLPNHGRGAVQESSETGVNTVELLRHCTKYSAMVSHIDQLEWKLVSAIVASHQLPAGPAHISVPLDIMRTQLPFTHSSYDISALTKPIQFHDPEAEKRLVKLVTDARRIVIVVGERCIGAVDGLQDLSVHLNATIVATPQGKGLVSPYHPKFRGVYGVAGHESAIAAVSDPKVDLILAVGTSLDEASTLSWDNQGLTSARLVHIDSIPQYFHRSPMAKLRVCGDIRSIVERLLEACPPRDTKESEPATVIKFERRQKDRRSLIVRKGKDQSGRTQAIERRTADRRRNDGPGYVALRYFSTISEEKCRSYSSPVKPQRLMFDLSRLLPPSTRFVAEIGNSFLWAIHYLHPFNRRTAGRRETNRNLFHTGMGFSSMGWAIGSSIGIALASRPAPVVCITGDGSLLMSGQEITVAAALMLPIIYVVLNDASLGTVRHGQRLAGAEQVGFDLPEIDYAAMARAMGINSEVVYHPDDLAALDFERLCQATGPTLIDVHIDRDEHPPLGKRLEMLASGR